MKDILLIKFGKMSVKKILFYQIFVCYYVYAFRVTTLMKIHHGFNVQLGFYLKGVVHPKMKTLS